MVYFSPVSGLTFVESCLISSRSLSTSLPPLPMTIPGREGIDRHGELLRSPLNVYTRYASIRKTLIHVTPEHNVLRDVAGIIFSAKPVGRPRFVNTQSKSRRMCFLSQSFSFNLSLLQQQSDGWSAV